MVTFSNVKNNKEINYLIESSQKQLDALGYTEHSMRHINIVSNRAAEVLQKLDYNEHRVELARIAGYMHDIGNTINRVDHAHSGAILAYEILKDMGMNLEDRTEVMMAIGNHDEATGTAVSDISAALILADKSDVHRNRVRNRDIVTFDKHDKVNYAVTKTDFIMDREKRKVTLDITIDNTICPVLDYFDIFMERTKMSKYAAKYLNIWFELIIKDKNTMKNVIPEYKLGTDLYGARNILIKVDDSTTTKKYDSDGNLVKDSSDGDEKNENITEVEEKVNPDELRTADNYEAVKNIIEARLKYMKVEDYLLRFDESTGDISLEVSENSNTDYIAQYTITKGEFKIVDNDTSEVLLTNADLKEAKVQYSTSTSGTTVYLTIEFNQDAVEKLRDISKTYVSSTDADDGGKLARDAQIQMGILRQRK